MASPNYPQRAVACQRECNNLADTESIQLRMKGLQVCVRVCVCVCVVCVCVRVRARVCACERARVRAYKCFDTREILRHLSHCLVLLLLLVIFVRCLDWQGPWAENNHWLQRYPNGTAWPKKHPMPVKSGVRTCF